MKCSLLFVSVITALLTNPAQAFLHKQKGGDTVNETALETQGEIELTGEVWVDNWFSLWVNGEHLIEDSVPITTERSFNAERFTFRTNFPIVLAFEFRDFMENATGLEYIGTRKQQMGDGGAIAQFKTGDRTIAVTDTSWRCLVVQHAPVETSCESADAPNVDQGACSQIIEPVPENWQSPSFDDSDWTFASLHSESAVSPKDGYDAIDWDTNAKIIWGADLERDNIVYCRKRIDG